MTELVKIKPKLLSIAFGVRNDHYIENAAWRASTIMNYIAFGLEKVGRLEDVEIIVADWNSPSPMANELNLSAAARKIVRFFDVPPEVAIPAQLGSPFPPTVVINSAIRRASGEFTCLADIDCLYTPATLEILCRLLEGSIYTGVDLRKAIMPVSRRQVVQELGLCSPSVEEIDYYLSHFANLADEDRLSNGTVGWAGSFIMHRDLWDECGGLNEKTVYWGWADIDLVLRTTRRYPWINLSNFGVTVFHMGHAPNYFKETSKGKKKTARINPHQIPHPYRYNLNDQDWGQRHFDLPVYACHPSFNNTPSGPPCNSKEWRFNKLKGLSRKIVQEQLVSDEIRQPVLGFMNGVEKNIPIKVPGIRHGIKCYQALLDQRNSNDWDYLSAITWYCRNFFPLTYVEAGMGRGVSACLAAFLYPPVSIYGFESWDPFDNPLALHPLALGQMLTAANHRGYLRYITEQSAEAYSQFWEQSGSPSSADLIVYANPYPADRVLKEIRPLLQHLAQGGCLILQHLDAAIFGKVVSSLRAEFSDLAWFTNSQCAMVINTASLPDWSEAASQTSASKWSPKVLVSGLSLNDVSNRVEGLLTEGREEEAVGLIRTQIQAKPGNAGTYLLMGMVLKNLDLPRNSQYYFERCIALDPDEMAGHANLAIVLAAVVDWIESEKVINNYLQKFPGKIVMVRLLGDVLSAQNKFEEAFEIYQNALALDPNDINSLSGIATCALEIGDLAGAKSALDILLKLQPGVPEIEEKWKAINQRISAASETIQKILSPGNMTTAIQQNTTGLSADVIYLLRFSAADVRAQGKNELAASYETLAQSLQYQNES